MPPLWGLWVAWTALILLAALTARFRVRRPLARLEKQGWRRLAPDDEGLGSALEDLRPFDLTDELPDDGERPPASVAGAWAGPRGRYAAQLQTRTVDSDGYRVWFQTVALGRRPLDVPGVIYVLARDRPASGRTVERLGLRRVDVGQDLHFGVIFVMYDNVWGEARLPRALQEALVASVDLFVARAGRRPGYVPDVALRLSPTGWALLAPHAVSTDAQTRAFLETAERVARAIA